MFTRIRLQNKQSLIHLEVRGVCFVSTWGSAKLLGLKRQVLQNRQKSLLKTWTLPGVLANACNPNSQEAETGGWSLNNTMRL